MDHNQIEFLVESIDTGAWLPGFEQQLATFPPEFSVTVTSPTAGILGPARAKSKVAVKANGGGGFDATVKLLGLLLSALALSVSSLQYMKDDPKSSKSDQVSLTCIIEGPNGMKELRIDTPGTVDLAVLRDCLAHTGYPNRISARRAR
jgi:hypothetical protein